MKVSFIPLVKQVNLRGVLVQEGKAGLKGRRPVVSRRAMPQARHLTGIKPPNGTTECGPRLDRGPKKGALFLREGGLMVKGYTAIAGRNIGTKGRITSRRRSPLPLRKESNVLGGDPDAQARKSTQDTGAQCSQPVRIRYQCGGSRGTPKEVSVGPIKVIKGIAVVQSNGAGKRQTKPQKAIKHPSCRDPIAREGEGVRGETVWTNFLRQNMHSEKVPPKAPARYS